MLGSEREGEGKPLKGSEDKCLDVASQVDDFCSTILDWLEESQVRVRGWGERGCDSQGETQLGQAPGVSLWERICLAVNSRSSCGTCEGYIRRLIQQTANNKTP